MDAVKQGEVELQGRAGLCKDRSYGICALLRKIKDPGFQAHKGGSESPLLAVVWAWTFSVSTEDVI